MFDRSRLTAARESAGISKTDLARLSGVSLAAIHGYETGRRTPHADQLGAIANALGCSVDYLLGLVDLETDRLIQRIKADPNLATALAVVVSHR